MADGHTSVFRHVLERFFPHTPDFFRLLSEQCVMVLQTVDYLVGFMESADLELAAKVKQNEHDADIVKVRNIHQLNQAFSTPIDREDIYRSIMDLDEIVNYCKSTVGEMDVLGVSPDAFTLEMSQLLRGGVESLAQGFGRLASTPHKAAENADAARKAERRVERVYRRAIADLFQGTDYVNMFKRREIYRHLSNAADRLAHCGNTLHDIVVKIT